MIQGIRYSYSDGGSVDIKYPRQKFQQGTFQDVNQASPYQNSQAVSGAGKNIITLSNGQQVMAPQGQGEPAGQVQNVQAGFAQVPETQTGGGGSGGGGRGGGSGANITSGIFDDVGKVFNDFRQNTMENQSVANSIFNRNMARKNFALQEATTASNLRGAGQQQQQGAIQFGQQQEDRSKQLQIAGAWASGVANGLTSGRT
jgi:hypothetical protein